MSTHCFGLAQHVLDDCGATECVTVRVQKNGNVHTMTYEDHWGGYGFTSDLLGQTRHGFPLPEYALWEIEEHFEPNGGFADSGGCRIPLGRLTVTARNFVFDSML